MQINREIEGSPEIVNNADRQYLALLEDILANGTESKDRTGTGTRKVFGRHMHFDLSEGFPLLTTKSVWFKGVKEELLWFIRGERNIRDLVLKDVHIWDEWPFQKYLSAKALDGRYPKYTPDWEQQKELFIERVKNDAVFARQWGGLGPVYGYQWRHWQTRSGREIDQLAVAIDKIRNKPNDRRIIVTAWNPEDVDDVALPPCHLLYQFQVDGDNLNCVMYQRSVDTFLGLPFNIASYALLTSLIAKITDKVPGHLTLFLADTHIYLNHLEQVKEQLSRGPRALPRLVLEPGIVSLETISSELIRVESYNPHPPIKAPISV